MRLGVAVIRANEQIDPVIVIRIADWQAERDRLGWYKQVEGFITASGTRSLLEHVTNDEWDKHYAANEDAYEAVVAELERVSE